MPNSKRRSHQGLTCLFHSLLLGFLVIFAWPGTATSQFQTPSTTLNDKVLNFMSSKLDQRIGGGESADAVYEALRLAGAAFTEKDLGTDYPSVGDKMWGTPVKVVSYQDNKFTDSNPSTDVLPGDILQYKQTKFVYVTTSGRKTTTTTVTKDHHSTVASEVDSKTKLPTRVYEQNAPGTTDVNVRSVSQNSVDFGRLREGMVLIYRPRIRIDAPTKYQISVVNNTNAVKLPVLKSRLNTVARLTLNPSNTEASYMVAWANSQSADVGLKLVLPSGESISVVNGGGYEIYKQPNGVVGVRAVTP